MSKNKAPRFKANAQRRDGTLLAQSTPGCFVNHLLFRSDYDLEGRAREVAAEERENEEYQRKKPSQFAVDSFERYDGSSSKRPALFCA